MKPKRTRITLGPMDAAWVLRADGSEEVLLPHGGDDDIVPDHCMRLVAAICSVTPDELPGSDSQEAEA